MSQVDGREEKILAALDLLTPDVVDFTCRLVAQPSTLGNEASVLAETESSWASLGFAPERIAVDTGTLGGHPGFAPVPWSYKDRYNVVAMRQADRPGGRSALFNGHLDVVSPEPLGRWQTDPFSPIVRDGWILGRGAGDMKAGVAAMTYAVKAFERAGFGLCGPVTLEAVIEEECTGNGALACLAAGCDADAVLIPEPFGPTLLVSQVGVLWFKVSLSGVPRHVLETGRGVNAIEKCFPIMEKLRGLEDELNREVHPSMAHLEHPLNLNIGKIRGGDWPSTVPAMAEIHCRLGFSPGVPFENVRRRVEETISQAAESDGWLKENPPQVEFYGFRSEGHCVERNQPAFELLAGCHRDLTGETALDFASTATTDLRAFVHFGKGQATCFGPIAENIHAENERVRIASVVHTAKAYALFLARWCGVAE